MTLWQHKAQRSHEFQDTRSRLERQHEAGRSWDCEGDSTPAGGSPLGSSGVDLPRQEAWFGTGGT